jgi:hypothetical protein
MYNSNNSHQMFAGVASRIQRVLYSERAAELRYYRENSIPLRVVSRGFDGSGAPYRGRFQGLQFFGIFSCQQ